MEIKLIINGGGGRRGVVMAVEFIELDSSPEETPTVGTRWALSTIGRVVWILQEVDQTTTLPSEE